MAAADKLYEKMLLTKSGWSSTDLETLYLGFGFRLRNKGGHSVYTHPVHRDLSAVVPRHRQIGEVYVHKARQIIALLKSREQE